MKIEVFQPLNTRQAGAGRTYQKGIIRQPGEVIEVLGTVTGENISGNDQWYNDGNGNFYWTGGAKVMPDTCPPSKLVAGAAKTQFQWFTNLGIQNIWNTYNTYGQGVTIAVLDTGYDLCNRDLAPAVTGQNIFLTPPPAGVPTINDIKNHGTFCSSIIAARNLFQYTIGIAPQCNLLMGKISNFGEPYAFDDLVNALNWATANGANIISISFGQDCPDPAVAKQLQDLVNNIQVNNNVMIIAACGDFDKDDPTATTELFPATLNGVISVGATDAAGGLSTGTLLSTKTIIHAQGENIMAYSLGETPLSGEGTSFSAPIVAGVAALAISYLTAQGKTWTWSDLRDKIYATGTNIPGSATRKLINAQNLFTQLSQINPPI